MQAIAMSGYEGALAVGQKRMVVFIGTGPASYVATGDPLSLAQFPHLDLPIGGVTVSGTYRVEFKPDVAGPRANWTALWFTVATASTPEAPVAAGTNLSAEKLIGWALGGDF